MSWGGSEKNRWFHSTRRFDQYSLIVFWRMLKALIVITWCYRKPFDNFKIVFIINTTCFKQG